ncbi:hypothetical protein Gotur_006800 [Gossypium turneri]
MNSITTQKRVKVDLKLVNFQSNDENKKSISSRDTLLEEDFDRFVVIEEFVLKPLTEYCDLSILAKIGRNLGNLLRVDSYILDEERG